jgi:hypothetical protein
LRWWHALRDLCWRGIGSNRDLSAGIALLKLQIEEKDELLGILRGIALSNRVFEHQEAALESFRRHRKYFLHLKFKCCGHLRTK